MKKTVCFLLAILTVALTACNKIAPAASDGLPQAAYLIDEAIIDNIENCIKSGVVCHLR